ncbi:hypothetical protein BDR04DRAFT_1157415 [Suillus decipiens]|nr:hypothetical protein BDR04DRAFT_1157415 [Suillus decipiens]
MTTFYMPLHHMLAAPFFDSNPVDLLTFLIMVDQLADMVGIMEVAHIKVATQHTHPNEAKLWECLEEYNGNNYEKFANTVFKMLILQQSAITITHSTTTNEEADTTKIEHECLPTRYSIDIEATPFTEIETMQQNPQPPCAPRLALIEEIPDTNDSHIRPFTSTQFWLRKQSVAISTLATH